jgi:peptidoglycan pentaglycine glycine transferase (the first glycine)
VAYQSRILNEQDKDFFNQFVAGHPKGHLLQTWEWGEVKARTGWEPIRLLLYKDDEPIAALSMLKRKIPGIGKSILYAPRGPVALLDDYEAMDQLWQAVRQIGRDQGAIMLKIDPDVPVSEDNFVSYLEKAGFRPAKTAEGFEGTQPRFVFRLDISPPEEELFAAFHSKTRYNIRLATRRGVTVRITNSKEDLKTFYEVLKVTAERDGFLIRNYDYFATLWDLLVERGLASVFLAEYEGKVIAGTLALVLGDKAWYLYGASSNEHRNVMPNYLLQWEMIKWAKEHGCTMYDFRGVSGDLSEDNPLYGLYRFKKGFNGEFTEFVGEYDLVLSPFYYHLWNVAEPLYYKNLRTIVKIRDKFR